MTKNIEREEKYEVLNFLIIKMVASAFSLLGRWNLQNFNHGNIIFFKWIKGENPNVHFLTLTIIL